MMYLSFNNNTPGATCGTGTAHPSRAPEFTPGFIGGGKTEYTISKYKEKTTDLLQVTDKTLFYNVVSSTPRHDRDSNSPLLW